CEGRLAGARLNGCRLVVSRCGGVGAAGVLRHPADGFVVALELPVAEGLGVVVCSAQRGQVLDAGRSALVVLLVVVDIAALGGHRAVGEHAVGVAQSGEVFDGGGGGVAAGGGFDERAVAGGE